MRLRLVAIGAAAVLSLSGCAIFGPEGRPGGAGMKKPALAPTTAEDAVDAVRGADGVQRATVTLTDGLRFTPSTVRAQPGTVELTFVNGGATPTTWPSPTRVAPRTPAISTAVRGAPCG
ncbi:hypothetical protein ACFQX7_03350 [Luedemannella flava]